MLFRSVGSPTIRDNTSDTLLAPLARIAAAVTMDVCGSASAAFSSKREAYTMTGGSNGGVEDAGIAICASPETGANTPTEASVRTVF